MTTREIERLAAQTAAEVLTEFDYAPLERARYGLPPRDAAQLTAAFSRLVDELRRETRREVEA